MHFLREYYYSYILSPLPIVIIALFLCALFMIIKFVIVIVNLNIMKREEVSNKNVNIQSIITTVFLIFFLTSFIKIYRYNTHDKFLVEVKNNLVYTVAYLDNIEQEKHSRYNIIREYRGEFTFFIDDTAYGDKFVLPKDFTNYIYFVKINVDNIKYSEILPVPISDLPRDIEKVKIPKTGWNTNPIPSIIGRDKNLPIK